MPNGPDIADLNPAFGNPFQQLLNAVRKAGGNPTVTSGYRSLQQQTALYNSGNGGVPVAKPGSSLHERGLAADVTGDSKTVGLLHSLAGQFGLAFPFSNDPVHVQLADGSGNIPNTANGTGSPQAGTQPQGPMPLADRLNALANMFSQSGVQVDTNASPSTSVAAPSTTVGAPSTGDQTQQTQLPTQGRSATPESAFTNPEPGQSAPGGNYAALFNQMGAKYGVNPALLSAVAKQESGFNPTAHSGAGAQGLMQLMPGTAHGLGVDPNNPVQAVDGAARLLSGYMKQYGGDIAKSLAAYNAGPGAVAHYNGVPPYAETQKYIKNIMATMGSGSND